MPQLNTRQLAPEQQQALLDLLAALIDQQQARVLIEPQRRLPGFWFGGGNLVQDENGVLWLCGRYRNFGDSRTGLEAGERGLECALFRSDDGGQRFDKVASWSKADLSRPDRQVVSIEGTSLHRRADGQWELFISSEKAMAYPDALASYQKPGAGVWTIDCLSGPSPDQLDVRSLAPSLENQSRPEYLHVKDPVVFDLPDGATAMIFCSHPFTWSSSNSGLAIREAGGTEFWVEEWEMVGRGASWDVAATRVTAAMAIPRVGLFAKLPPATVYFYDGAECLRDHDENARAHRRPRGYSCEEIGGACFGWDDDFPRLNRLSNLAPLFVSPWGTGTSRYVDVLVSERGLFAIWEQGQVDGSQPLVGNFLEMEAVERLLSGKG